MQFECFYQTVGSFGRYQKLKYFLVCLTYMLPPIMVYTWTFTAATPVFQCRTSSEEFNANWSRYMPSESQCREYKKQISIDECQRCYRNGNASDDQGPLQECENFVFDRTYYRTTLVEEVCFLIFERIRSNNDLFSVVNGM